jgi:hypothetical protein
MCRCKVLKLSLSIFVLALLVEGCTSGPNGDAAGTYVISWTLSRTSGAGGLSCDDLKIDHIRATITDEATNDTTIQSAPCIADKLTTDPIPLGSHMITLEAFGPAGDLATSEPAKTLGTLAVDRQVVTLPPQTLEIADPTTYLHETWKLTKRGAQSSCGAIAQNGVAVFYASDGAAPNSDIWDCTEPNSTIEIPLAAFSAYAQLLDYNDKVISTSATTQVPATRGTVSVVFELDAP